MASKSVGQELNDLLNELNEESIAEMDYEELMEYRKKLNVYGRTIEGSDKYVAFSFSNLQEQYMQRLLMTGMVGFLNRMCDEWHVPDGIPVVPVYEYAKDPSKITSFADDWKITNQLAEDIEENKRWMEKRLVVKEFLEEMFQFNPDDHVKSAHKPHRKDIDRKIIDTPAANLALEHYKKKDLKFREQILEFDRVQQLIEMNKSIHPNQECSNEHLNEMVVHKLVLPEHHYSIMNFEKWSDEDKNLLRTACEMIPPQDTFHRFRTYFEGNYDKVREAVLHLYCDKPDFDIAINPYGVYDSREDANEFQKKHKDEVIADIIIADTGKWNFFAPFAKVRESTKYYNSHTYVLESMAEQMESDAKMGGELMKKRVQKQKARNVIRDGPDHPSFEKWKKQNSSLAGLGAIEVNNKESMADDECGHDEIQIDVFRLSQGGLKMEKNRIFVEAEAPSLGSS